MWMSIIQLNGSEENKKQKKKEFTPFFKLVPLLKFGHPILFPFLTLGFSAMTPLDLRSSDLD
jgi:hypothetical protein